MSRKQKKKDAREQSTRQLMGIDDITDYGIATRMGELVFFIIKPTNISVLPDAGVGARIYALLNVVKGMAEIEMLALNSKESFENNKAFYRQRANEEELPVIRKLLEQDSKHLDRIQVLMASSREFYILVRLQGKKESDVFSYRVEEQAARRVYYADQNALTRAIVRKYPPKLPERQTTRSVKGEGQLHDAPVQEMVVAEDIDYDRMPHKRTPYNLPRQEVDR